MYNLIDLRNINWGITKSNGSSYGCYIKSSRIEGSTKYYYKLPSYNSSNGFIGEEPIYEVICSRFLRKLGFNCVQYKLIKCLVKLYGVEYITYACKSADFSIGYDSRIPFEVLREMDMEYSIDQFITKYNFSSDIINQILADFLVIGRDRHGRNIEVLIKDGDYSIAPIFDNGLSLLAPIPVSMHDSKARVVAFDPLKDVRVNNYIGEQSLYRNLRYITKPVSVNKLRKADKGHIFYNLSEVLPKYYVDKCWQILTYRYMFLRKRGLIIEK